MSSFVQLVLRAGGGWGRSGGDSAGRGVQGADPGSGRRWPWNDGQHLCQVLVKSGNLHIFSRHSSARLCCLRRVSLRAVNSSIFTLVSSIKEAFSCSSSFSSARMEAW